MASLPKQFKSFLLGIGKPIGIGAIIVVLMAVSTIPIVKLVYWKRALKRELVESEKRRKEHEEQLLIEQRESLLRQRRAQIDAALQPAKNLVWNVVKRMFHQCKVGSEKPQCDSGTGNWYAISKDEMRMLEVEALDIFTPIDYSAEDKNSARSENYKASFSLVAPRYRKLPDKENVTGWGQWQSGSFMNVSFFIEKRNGKWGNVITYNSESDPLLYDSIDTREIAVAPSPKDIYLAVTIGGMGDMTNVLLEEAREQTRDFLETRFKRCRDSRYAIKIIRYQVQLPLRTDEFAFWIAEYVFGDLQPGKLEPIALTLEDVRQEIIWKGRVSLSFKNQDVLSDFPPFDSARALTGFYAPPLGSRHKEIEIYVEKTLDGNWKLKGAPDPEAGYAPYYTNEVRDLCKPSCDLIFRDINGRRNLAALGLAVSQGKFDIAERQCPGVKRAVAYVLNPDRPKLMPTP